MKNRSRLSIVIPAFNEEKYLPDCLAAIDRSRDAGPGFSEIEVIVVDNASTDATAEIAARMGANIATEAEHKISKVKNAGAGQATGDFILFVDADTVIEESALAEVGRVIQDSNCLAGGGYVRFDIGGAVAVIAWLLNHAFLRFGWAWGSFLFCDRSAFEELGGFDESLYGTEEVALCGALRRKAKSDGRKFRIIPRYMAVTSGRRIKPQLKTLIRRILILFDLRKNMQDPEVCRPVWYSEDR